MKIDEATYEDTIRRKWFTPGAHDAPQGTTLHDWPADDYESGLASREPMPTEPGDLDETRRSVDGFGGLLLSMLLVFVGVVIGSLLSRYWPAIVGWGGW